MLEVKKTQACAFSSGSPWYRSFAKARHRCISRCGEYAAISHRLTNRVIELAERYKNTLPELDKDTTEYEAKVKSHLERMECVLGACAENSIYEINEMLKENGITPLGSDPDLQ